MRSAPPPPLADDDVQFFRACIERRRDPHVKSALTMLIPAVQQAYGAYSHSHGDPAVLNPVRCSEQDRETLRGNFDLMDKGRTLMSRREALMEWPKTDFCLMCGVAVARSLDHYLPRCAYPEFSVLSLNLVPVCSDCNRVKGSYYSQTPDNRFLHAYYDVLPDRERVLFARIEVSEDRVRVSFELAPAPSLSDSLFNVLRFHFHKLDLPHFYEQMALRQLPFHSRSCATLADGTMEGHQRVESYLCGLAEDAESTFGLHSWESALLRGLQCSKPFIEGGFRLVTPARSR